MAALISSWRELRPSASQRLAGQSMETNTGKDGGDVESQNTQEEQSGTGTLRGGPDSPVGHDQVLERMRPRVLVAGELFVN